MGKDFRELEIYRRRLNLDLGGQGMPPKLDMMYFINIRTSIGWEHRYIDFTCDADAMVHARHILHGSDVSMVAVYRHRDRNTCGIKDFVVAYDR